ncbi:unnamed protein product [Candida verbasci]|uniref:Oxidant-induced cell-cycle arrest protein 5 n=1 Tax=Candida verbasci TaxID=1227364 RepID=A0A9W4TZD7_9ASCO|nr:unnamed protein product [Candida verbasci]
MITSEISQSRSSSFSTKRPELLNNSSSFTTMIHDQWVQMDKLSHNEESMTEQIQNMKIRTIYGSLESYNREKDINILIEAARSTDGLISNELRKVIWPILLNIDMESKFKTNLLSDSSNLLSQLDNLDLPPHKDEDQVKLDVQRSFTLFNHIQSLKSSTTNSYSTILSTSDVKNIKNKLSNLIIKILRKYPNLNYYQGFHDVSSIVLLVCYDSELSEFNEDMAFKILEKLTPFHLRDFMLTDINLTVNHLRLIPTLLENIDLELFNLIKSNSNCHGNYDYKFFQAISSIITIYSHDISNLSQILQIWDFLLSYDSVIVSIYIYVAALITLKPKIWKTLNIEDDDFTSVDSALSHTTLSPTQLFENLSDLTLIKILNKAKSLIENCPIDNLDNSESTYNKWFLEYNKKSVLCNTSNINNRDSDLELYSNEVLSSLIQDQDDQISKQIIDEIQEQELLEEELGNSISSLNESDNSNSLSSSLTLHTSITSSSIHKLTSTTIFKKLFNKESKEVISRPNWYIRNFYRLSLTIGVIGFLLHFLIKDEIHNFINSMLNSDMFKHTSIVLENVKEFFSFDHVNNIGIGNLRNTVYSGLRTFNGS